jgi:hypothetical protein
MSVVDGLVSEMFFFAVGVLLGGEVEDSGVELVFV